MVRFRLGRPPHILVVDDEPDICWVLENILKSEGYQVTAVTSGREALELAREKRFKVAFIDAKLPDVDGVELSNQIKEINPKAAIVIISGYFYPEDKAIEEGLTQGRYAGFVSKPFDLDEIRLAAKEALKVAGGRR